MEKLHSNFVFTRADETVINMDIIWKRFYTKIFIDELNPMIYNSHQLCCLCVDIYYLSAYCGCWSVVYIKRSIYFSSTEGH